MALYFFRNGLRHSGIHIYSLWTRKDNQDLRPLLKTIQWLPISLHLTWNSTLWKRLSLPTGSGPALTLVLSQIWGGGKTSHLPHSQPPYGVVGALTPVPVSVPNDTLSALWLPSRWHSSTFSKNTTSDILTERRILSGEPIGIFFYQRTY